MNEDQIRIRNILAQTFWKDLNYFFPEEAEDIAFQDIYDMLDPFIEKFFQPKDHWIPWPPKEWDDIKEGTFYVSDETFDREYPLTKFKQSIRFPINEPLECPIDKIKWWKQE